MAIAVKKGADNMKRKIVSISPKRQITIPLSYYSTLGFSDTAECIIRGNELIVRPAVVNASGEFAEQILAELIAQGLSGEELLEQFKLKQSQIRPAVEKIIEQADAAADGNGEIYTYDDIFGPEE